MTDRDADFTAYLEARQGRLLRTAYLLTGDQHQAEDLLQTSLAKLYLSWDKVRDRASIDALRPPDHGQREQLGLAAPVAAPRARDRLRGRRGARRHPVRHGYDEGVSDAVWQIVQTLPRRARRGRAALLRAADRGGDRRGARHLRRHRQVPDQRGRWPPCASEHRARCDPAMGRRSDERGDLRARAGAPRRRRAAQAPAFEDVRASAYRIRRRRRIAVSGAWPRRSWPPRPAADGPARRLTEQRPPRAGPAGADDHARPDGAVRPRRAPRVTAPRVLYERVADSVAIDDDGEHDLPRRDQPGGAVRRRLPRRWRTARTRRRCSCGSTGSTPTTTSSRISVRVGSVIRASADGRRAAWMEVAPNEAFLVVAEDGEVVQRLPLPEREHRLPGRLHRDRHRLQHRGAGQRGLVDVGGGRRATSGHRYPISATCGTPRRSAT